MTTKEQAQAALEALNYICDNSVLKVSTVRYIDVEEFWPQIGEIKEAITTLEAMVEDGWQPIESAPKDKTPFAEAYEKGELKVRNDLTGEMETVQPTMSKFDEALKEVDDWEIFLKRALGEKYAILRSGIAIETIRAALTQAAEIERGDKVVVPREPTVVMNLAGNATLRSKSISATDIYKAMIAASEDKNDE